MIKTRKLKVKNIENEEIIMAMTMAKTIITKIIITNNHDNENQIW